MRVVWRRVRAAVGERLARVRPGPRAWRGAWIGVVAVTSVVLLATGTMLASGRGLVADALLALAVGWVSVVLLTGVLLVLGWLLRGVPGRLRALGFAALLVVAAPFVLAGPYAVALGAVLLVGGALAGAGVASMARRRPARRSQAVLAGSGVVVGLALLAAVGVWLIADGEADDGATPAPEGALPVATFTYGSGDHPRRSEYGAEVDARTSTVDGRAFLERWSGWRGGVRTRYWGFGPDALPRNATVWYPEVQGRFPLVLVVHGNHPMERPSDLGYTWLARDLASRGYVVASVDQNFLNISLARGWDLGDENDARAWLLLEHLRQWRGWEAAPTHPAHERVDLDRIALIGHSRGGEAVATAAVFDRLERYPEDASIAFDAGFGIDAVVAVAPTDAQYVPAGRPTDLEDVSYLALHGGLDGDVFSFAGLLQYQRATFTGDTPGVKAAVYLPDANHGQFNTLWGRHDLGGLGGRVLDTDAIMPPKDQRATARTAIVGFLDTALRDDPSGLEPLHDPGHPAWPEGSGVITRFTDDTEVTIAGYDEDPDPATGTLPGSRITSAGFVDWREEPVRLRWGDRAGSAAVLRWEPADGDAASYRVRLPAGWTAPAEPVLMLTLAGSDAVPEPLDLTVEVVDADGQVLRTTLAERGGVPPAQPSRRFKPPLREWLGDLEPVAQTFRIPLDTGAVDPSAIAEVLLVFDRSPDGAVFVEHVAIASGAGG